MSWGIKHERYGFTIVEIIIAIVLVLGVFGTLFSIYVGGMRRFKSQGENSGSSYGIHRLFSQLSRDLLQHGDYSDDFNKSTLTSRGEDLVPDKNKLVLQKALRIESSSGAVQAEKIIYEFLPNRGRLSRNGVPFASLEFESFQFSLKSTQVTEERLSKRFANEVQTLVVQYKLKDGDSPSVSRANIATSFEFNLWHLNERNAFQSWNSPLESLKK